MPKVYVEYVGSLAVLVGKVKEVITITGKPKFADLVAYIADRSPDIKITLDEAQKSGTLLIAVNGKMIDPVNPINGMQTPLTSGDNIIFSPPYEGG